jgi:predicted  nucleic acid-binding Zn-ribbon protein
MSSSQNQDSRGKLLPWAGAIIVALLGTNAYLWTNKSTTETKLGETVKVLDDTKTVRDSLQRVYEAAVVELEGMKGKNSELNLAIDKQKADLQSQKSKIDAALSSGNKDKKALQEALRQIEELKSQAAGALAQVSDLQNKLGVVQEQLKTEVKAKEEVTAKLTEVTTAHKETETKLATTSEAKGKLEEEKKKLDNKVDVASVVRVNNFDDPQGFEVSKKNGKESSVSKAQNMERVRFCFDAQENHVAKAGSESFYVAIQDATGVTIEGPGGGVTKLNDGTEAKYTFVQTQELSNAAHKVCTQWDPATKLQKGSYNISVYNKGYVAGKHSFLLKK